MLAALLPRAAGSCVWTLPQREQHRGARICRYTSAIALPRIVPFCSSLSCLPDAGFGAVQRTAHHFVTLFFVPAPV